MMKIALAVLILALRPVAQDDQVVRDRKDFIPDPEKPLAVKAGRHVMVLVAEAGPLIGPNLARVGINTLVLSGSGSGYRWCYLGTPEKRGPLATYDNTLDFGVTRPTSIVEVDVQEGTGSPDGKPPLFASSMKVLDGTPEYGIQAHRAVAEARARYAEWLKQQEKAIAPALEKARVEAGGDATKAKPARTATLMYVTWMEETETLQVRFLTRVETTDDVMKPSKHVGELKFPDTKQYWGVDFGRLFEFGRKAKAGTVARVLTLPMEGWKGASAPRPMIDWRDFPAAAKDK